MNDVWSTQDLQTWTEMTPAAAWPPRRYMAAVAFQNQILMIGGTTSMNNFNTQVNEVWASSDGANWNLLVDEPLFGTPLMPRALVYSSKVFVLAQAKISPTSGQMGKLLSSADGASWSVVREDLTIRNKFGFVRHGQHLLFMGGKGPTGVHHSDVAVSNNGGNSWTQLGTAPWAGRTDFGAVSWNNHVLVIGGVAKPEGETEGVGMNDIWSTVDGSSWTEETQAPFPGMKVDIFGLLNNRIVILGGNPLGTTEWYSEIWASDPATPPPTPIPTFPAWGGGFFQSDHGGGAWAAVTPEPTPPTPPPSAFPTSAQPSCSDPFLRNRDRSCGVQTAHVFRGCDAFVPSARRLNTAHKDCALCDAEEGCLQGCTSGDFPCTDF